MSDVREDVIDAAIASRKGTASSAGEADVREVGICIIGGGAAGLAAALGAYEAGVPAADILIVERETALGGILKQCIHNGFGLHRFDEELTGPEYAQRDIDVVTAAGIPFLLDTTVLSLSQDRTVVCVNAAEGVIRIRAGAVVLAMGSRERTRGMLGIAGDRPSGIYTAGTAQAFVNLRGEIPGKRIVMLGSGDIGLIMARRLTYEGCEVVCVLNRSSFSGGLKRNIVQCLDDYDIPLIFNRTITAVHGDARLTGVTVSHVDPATKKPIPGTEELIACDTLLLSAGLMPENELTRAAGIALDRGTGGAVVDQTFQTSAPGIFSAGNVLHVHDLVDFVSEEGLAAGACAARFMGCTGTGEMPAASQSEKPAVAAGGALAAGGAPAAAVAGEASAAVADEASAAAGGAPAAAVAPTFSAEPDAFITVHGGSGVGAPVPQFIARDSDDDVTIRFRVRGVFEDARLRVLVDGREVARPKRRIMVPAEMESVTLKAADRIGATTVEIAVEEKEASHE